MALGKVEDLRAMQGGRRRKCYKKEIFFLPERCGKAGGASKSKICHFAKEDGGGGVGWKRQKWKRWKKLGNDPFEETKKNLTDFATFLPSS